MRTPAAVLLCLLLAACAGGETSTTVARSPSTSATTTTAPGPFDEATVDPIEKHSNPVPPTTAAPTAPLAAAPRPAWLGTRPLPLRKDGFGQVLPTPPELDPRDLVTPDHLPPPPDGGFRSTVGPVPDDVLARSTWDPACPVTRDDLRYVTVSFVGFDDRFHTGELLVHAEVADAVVSVFERLHAARFPIEEMRITTADELDLPPLGDGNNTGAFVCRPTRGTTSWSEHAKGLAVDINPFHNPYVKGDLVLPELASTYADRSDVRDGMIVEGSVAVEAFDALGWQWGGRWRSLTDPMHFSRDGG